METLTSTKITSLSPNDLDYIRVHQRFKSSLPQVKIQGILLLQMPKHIFAAHNALRKNTPVHGMYHGTKSVCDPGNLITRKTPICKSNACGVCGIIRQGNKISYSRDGQLWFGGSPIISNGYTGGLVNKAIFCVDVLSSTPPQDYLTIQSEANALPRFLVIFQ